MGLFDRFRNTAVIPARPESTLGPADTLPADSGSLATRATQIYKNNPKVVGGLALLASALILNRMKRPPA
jgi:hypothetical protein